MPNPLADAVAELEKQYDLVATLMWEVRGERAFEPFDEELSKEIYKLIHASLKAVDNLGKRARRARLNLIWKEFLATHATHATPPPGGQSH